VFQLLSSQGEAPTGLRYAGAAFAGLPDEVRQRVHKLATISGSPVGVNRKTATWLEPSLRLRVRHLRGDGGLGLRHASVKGLAK